MAEFSPAKWSKYLRCHMVVKKGTHIDDNLGNFAMLYLAIVVVMMGDSFSGKCNH